MNIMNIVLYLCMYTCMHAYACLHHEHFSVFVYLCTHMNTCICFSADLLSSCSLQHICIYLFMHMDIRTHVFPHVSNFLERKTMPSTFACTYTHIFTSRYSHVCVVYRSAASWRAKLCPVHLHVHTHTCMYRYSHVCVVYRSAASWSAKLWQVWSFRTVQISCRGADEK
jgi:hypothetical protein